MKRILILSAILIFSCSSEEGSESDIEPKRRSNTTH
jgi:hypothetical protein